MKALIQIKSSHCEGFFAIGMVKKIMFKRNAPILVLIFIVVGGVWYSLASGHSLFGRKPLRIDSRCYGVDVPKTIKYSQTENFCSCVHIGGHVSKEENYKYCASRFSN